MSKHKQIKNSELLYLSCSKERINSSIYIYIFFFLFIYIEVEWVIRPFLLKEIKHMLPIEYKIYTVFNDDDE